MTPRDSALSILHIDTQFPSLPRGKPHNKFPNSRSIFWRFLSSTPATHWYKTHSYTVNTHGVTGLAISNTQCSLLYNSCLDSIPFSGGCWTQHQLHTSILYVPTQSILVELVAGDLKTLMADYSTIAARILILIFGGC